MSKILKFSESLREFLQEVSGGSSVLVMTELQNLYNRGVISIEALVSGAGDSGNDCDFYFYFQNNDSITDRDVDISEYRELEDFAWAAASYTNPGYENNEGGGFNIQITFSEKGEVYFNGSGYVYVQADGNGFYVGEGDYNEEDEESTEA